MEYEQIILQLFFN